MFQALLTHLQEALHKRQLVYCVRVMSVGCTMIEVELRSTPIHHNLWKQNVYYRAGRSLHLTPVQGQPIPIHQDLRTAWPQPFLEFNPITNLL
jgi:hypothetical protein